MTAARGIRGAAVLAIIALALLGPEGEVAAGGPPAAACLITQVPSLAFGDYDVTSAAPNDVQSQLRVLCDSSILMLRVNLSQGLANSFSPRAMSAGGADRLQYNVYLNEQRSMIWGDGSGGTSYYSKSRPVLEYINLYGRIPAKQGVRAGTYSDTLKLTIYY